MAPTYYVIELSPRWLTALLVALALVMVLAFAFGYGAAWSVLAARAPAPASPPASVESPIPEVIIGQIPTPTPRPAVAVVAVTPPAPTATAAPRAVPRATATPRIEPGIWVQVLASSTSEATRQAGQRLEQLGFPSDRQRLTTTQVAGGGTLHKLRVGPFPDRESADRVVRRLRASGFPDAWVVTS